MAARTATALAVLLVWFALIFPDQLSRLTPGALLRHPGRGSAAGRPRSGAARQRHDESWRRSSVSALGLLAILKIVDMGFFSVLGQPFNPLTDWSYLGSAVGVLRDSAGPYWTVAAVGRRRPAAGRRARAPHPVGAAPDPDHRPSIALPPPGACARSRSSGCCAPPSAYRWPAAPVASTAADAFTQRRGGPALAVDDPSPTTPGARAAHRPPRQGRPRRVRRELRPRGGRGPGHLARGERCPHRRHRRRCAAAGFSSRSAFLTSPTYAGISWLAHATLQSGLWIDNQQRYNQLLQTDRLTLSAAFKRAGWRTVAAVAGEHQGLAGGHGVLPVRHDLRQPKRRLRGPELRLRHDARPVHAGRLAAQRTGPARTTPR